MDSGNFFYLFFHIYIINVWFPDDRNTPTSTEKCPITIEELLELMRLLARFVATTKNTTNLQKTDSAAHALLVKWNMFQMRFRNRVNHFLPRIGDHPTVLLKNVVLTWDAAAKQNVGGEHDTPVDFGPALVTRYQDYNKLHIPHNPVKKEDEEIILKIVPMDIRLGKFSTNTIGILNIKTRISFIRVNSTYSPCDFTY